MSIPLASLPADPRHQRLADLVLSGVSRGDAYGRCFPRTKKTSRNPAAARILKRPDVLAYTNAIRLAAANATLLSVQEKREYLARAVRTPRAEINPDDPKTSDLVVSWSRSETEMSNSYSIKTVDPLAAIARDNELAGDTINPLDSLAAALASLQA